MENTAGWPTGEGRLVHFPVAFFSVVMGLGGLTLALHAAHGILGLPTLFATIAFLATAGAFLLIGFFYLLKLIRHPGAVRGEWNHPVKIAFFPAISISLLLLAVCALPHSHPLAHGLWLVGTALQGVLAFAVITSWIGHRSFQHPHLGPAWFIPAVGNVIVPIAGMALGYAETSWFFFSMGLLFWIVLLTLVVNRLIFHDPLPARLQPTLVILIAPPAVGLVAYIALVGRLDHFAHVLLELAYVFAIIVLIQLPKLLRLPFSMSFWALSFPLAALTSATLKYGALTGSGFHLHLAQGLLAVLVLTITVLAWRTLMAIARGEICRPEPAPGRQAQAGAQRS